ncbi:helicase, partial [Propionimicrobium lymphophilum]|nr:helicase [Propionimicrobium lymphophilum]
MAELVRDGMQVLTFTPSRSQAELVALRAGRKAPGIASYRAGYLADERRGIEKALSEGELCGVAATNALELGIDIA